MVTENINLHESQKLSNLNVIPENDFLSESQMELVCRTCLSTNQLRNIFDNDMANNIMDCTGINISENDNLPHFICLNCFDNMLKFYNFVHQCREIDLKLRSKIKSRNKCNIENKITESTQNDFNSKANVNDHEEYRESTNIADLTPITSLENLEQSFQCNKTKLKEDKEKIKSGLFKSNVISKSRKKYQIRISISNTKIKSEKSKKQFLCEFCGCYKNSLVDLIRHRHVHTGAKPYQCQVCAKTFRVWNHLQLHHYTHNVQQNFQCSICSKLFKHPTNLQSHMRTHTNNIVLHLCNICNKQLSSNRSLQMHMKVHADERNFQCQHCDKAFIHRYDLKRHLELHEKKKIIENNSGLNMPYMCDICGKVFQDKSKLNRHQNGHLNEKPYKCNDCDKSFSSSVSLTTHKRIHTGEKPYSCSYCGKCFIQSTSCKRHIRTHRINQSNSEII